MSQLAITIDVFPFSGESKYFLKHVFKEDGKQTESYLTTSVEDNLNLLVHNGSADGAIAVYIEEKATPEENVVKFKFAYKKENGNMLYLARNDDEDCLEGESSLVISRSKEACVFTLHSPEPTSKPTKTLADWQATPCHIQIGSGGYVAYDEGNGDVQYTSNVSQSETFQLELFDEGGGSGHRAPGGYQATIQTSDD